MIIALVLLQKGKGAEAGAAFGAGASGTVFGAQGSTNFLSRATAVLAALFFANCLALAYLGSQRATPTSLLEGVGESSQSDPGAIPTDGVGTGDIPAAILEDEVAAEEFDAEIPDLPAELPETNDNPDTDDNNQ